MIDVLVSETQKNILTNGGFDFWTEYKPVHRWKLNEGSGATVADDGTGTAANGTITNATWTTGEYSDSAVMFDGTGDYIQTASVAFVLANTFTFRARVYPTGLVGGDRHTIFNMTNASDAGMFSIEINTGGVAVIVPGAYVATAAITLAPNNWYDIIYTKSGTAAGSQKVYVNGVPLALTIDIYNQVFADTAKAKNIGVRASPSTQGFIGKIDEVSIYSVALTQEQITTLYPNGVLYSADDWSVLAGQWGGNISRNAVAPYTGQKYSLELDGGAIVGVSRSINLQLKVGHYYLMSVWVKNSGYSTGTFNVDLSGTGWDTDTLAVGASISEWTRYTATSASLMTTVPSDLTLRIFLDNTPNAGSVWKVWGVMLEEVTVGTTTASPMGLSIANNIIFGSLTKTDNINQKTDTLSFNVQYGAGKTYRPMSNSDIIMMDSTDKVFGGKIYLSESDIQGNQSVVYKVSAKDYSYDLGRLLVIEEYDNMTIGAIISQMLADYAYGFTDDNVSCDILVSKMIFDHVSVLAAIEKMAQASGYSWYVDYDRDIHFFPSNTEAAPFDVTDNNGNYISDTLFSSDDFSQIRNRIFIKGAEVEGDSRSETLTGTGVQLQFKLSNKFAHVPTVTVGGASKTVGEDNLSNEADYDCFWNYTESFLRFKVTTVPAASANNIVVTGIPLYSLLLQVEDPISIAEYGPVEYAITDLTIKSREEGVALGKAQLTCYKDGLIQGGFETYTSGLRSGMIININSTILGIDEDFVIQSVNYKMVSPSQGYWKVTLATVRAVGLVDFLISMLRSGEKVISDTSTTVLEKTAFPNEGILVSDATAINTNNTVDAEGITATESVTPQALDYATVFVAGPYTPSGTNRLFCVDGSRLG